jgi:hypothetical protein
MQVTAAVVVVTDGLQIFLNFVCQTTNTVPKLQSCTAVCQYPDTWIVEMADQFLENLCIVVVCAM